MSQKRVLLLFGGESSEHEISISSARNVYAAIDKEKFDVTLGYIDSKGMWWLLEKLDLNISTDGKQELLPVLGSKSFITSPGGKTIELDVILPILHGRNGEDGTVQGLAQLVHIPIVGCDVTASGTAMNKLACKEVLMANDIAVIPFEVHREYEPIPNYDELKKRLGDTIFVKPARAGSSVGVSKIRSASEFKDGLKVAHEHDPIVLIEKAISGSELEVAVLGTPPRHKVSGVGEIIPGEEFYTYADKYATDSKAQINVTANIDKATKERVRDTANRAFEVLDCKGMARIDFMLGGDGQLYVMEVNTIPGFTNISMYPKLWQEMGIRYPQLIEHLIEDALNNK